MTMKLHRWDAADDIRTLADCRLYLQLCSEEDNGDGAMIRHALDAIARSRAGKQVARKVGITHDALMFALADKASDAVVTAAHVLGALGLTLHAGRRPPVEHLRRAVAR